MKKRDMRMNKKKHETTKIICGWLIMIGCLALGLYVGGWLMFIQPIIEACKAFDAGALTGLIVGTTVLKCLFAGTVGGLITYIGTLISMILFD